MTQTTQAISQLRQRMLDDMRMRKLSPKTQSGYIRAVKKFSDFLGRLPDTATDEDLRRYQLFLVEMGIPLTQVRNADNFMPWKLRNQCPALITRARSRKWTRGSAVRLSAANISGACGGQTGSFVRVVGMLGSLG